MQSEEIQLFSSKPRKKARRASERVEVTEDRKHGEEEDAKAAGERRAQAGDNGEPVDDGLDSFEALGVGEHLCAVLEGLGIADPTAVQKGCIPAIMKGRNVIGIAQTGSGKTAAFALPVLQALAKNPYGVFNLVLTPTRGVGVSDCRPVQGVWRGAEPAGLRCGRRAGFSGAGEAARADGRTW